MTRLADHVHGPFSFFLDIGCFRGLNADQRAALGAELTRVAADDASMLMMAFGPNRVPVIHAGIERAEIEKALPDWRVDHVEPASTDGMPKPVQASHPTFYRLVRA